MTPATRLRRLVGRCFGLRLAGRAAIALMMMLAIMPGVAHAKWETTKFEVFEGPPSEVLGWRTLERLRSGASTIPPALRDEIEAFMTEVARLYQDLGFADPVASGHLETIPGRNGDPVIRVYFQTPEETPGIAAIGGAYVSRNPDKDIWRSSLNINIAKMIINGRVPDGGYQTLAHELFHAVLDASAFTANGRAYGRWMSEGMPDALGYYAARKLRRLRFAQEHTDIQFIKVYGGRSYALPLEDPDEKLGEHYFTSSFWRYLAELTHASKNGKPHPGPGPAQEDYSYLAEFLAVPHSGPDNPTGQIAWLNRNTRSHPHIRTDLATVHAKFIAVLADIINTRINLSFAPRGESTEMRWLTRLFFDCDVAGPIRPHVQTSHTLPIRENAASCFRVDLSAIGQSSSVRIEATGADKDLLQQLRIGMPDGSFVSGPMIAARQGKGEHVASWTFPVVRNSAGQATFIIANMAQDPSRSRKQIVALKIAVEGYGFTMDSGTQGPLPPPPDYGPTLEQAGRDPGSTPTRRQVVERKLREKAARDPTIEDLVPVTYARRREDSGGCTAMRRKLNLCGDQLNITLQLALAGQQRNLLEGGAFDMFGAVFGFDGQAMLADGGRIALAMDRLTSGIAGRKIVIKLPMIDYGFTGGFDNAVVEVAKAGDDDHRYRAYGPTVWEGDLPHRRPPRGQVTILEYSPTILRGRFRADLVDEAHPGPSEAPAIASTIEGEFTITSPWQGDPDFSLDQGATRDTLIQNMLEQSPFGAGPMRDLIRSSGAPPQALCEAGLDEEQLAALGFAQGCASGSSASTGRMPQACSCDCELRVEEEQNPACQPVCRTAWTACPATAPAAMTAKPENAEQLEAQAAWLDERMREKNLPDAVRAQMLETFRRSPALGRDMMIKQFGG